jgi:SAM-dependent methyltransferase
MTDEKTPSPTSNTIKYRSRNPLQKFLLFKFLKEITNTIESLKFNSLLDAGCGEGFVLKKLQEENMLPGNAVGIDISREALKKAQFLLKEVEFKKGDIVDLPFKRNSFDLVICMEVLEHIRDYKKALRELIRVSDKYILVSVPWEPIFSLGNMARGKNVHRLGRDPQHVNFWSYKEMKSLLKDHELDIVCSKIVFPWQVFVCRVENK